MYRQLVDTTQLVALIAMGLSASPGARATDGLAALAEPEMLLSLALGVVALRWLRHLALSRPRR
ncbi:MAG: hypothetical protein AAF184_21965 [Pseudomonadota bacterium]